MYYLCAGVAHRLKKKMYTTEYKIQYSFTGRHAATDESEYSRMKNYMAGTGRLCATELLNRIPNKIIQTNQYTD